MLDLPIIEEQEDVFELVKKLTVPCYDCRLGYIQLKSRGLVHRGNLKATIATISIMPGPKEVETGEALTGGSGKLFDKWFESIGLNTNKHMWVCNIVQCKPPNIEKPGEDISQREPDRTEMATCFPNRSLRVLKAMPKLEVVITLGWLAASCILGEDAGEKSHMGHWYSTSLLPGKAVYCLPHPAGFMRDPTPEKEGHIFECLSNFKREYVDTPKIKEMLKQL